MRPEVETVDHVHIYVQDRRAAEQWYQRILGFERSREFEFWAADGGPLTIQNASGSVHLALFERSPEKNRATVAMRASAQQYVQWISHLRSELNGEVTVEDHTVSLSVYFKDPDGNPYEITTYEYEAAKGLTP